jgi:hypothetical protein
MNTKEGKKLREISATRSFGLSLTNFQTGFGNWDKIA